MDNFARHYLEKHRRKVWRKMQKMNKHRKSFMDTVRSWFKWI